MSTELRLCELLRELKRLGYHFTGVTPATHLRILARKPGSAPDLRDVLGWNRTFHERDLPASVYGLLISAGAIEKCGDQLRSRLRVSSLGDDLFLHSAFPTQADDAVFFGPDTYRFVRFIRHEMPHLPISSQIVDMGAGSGAGGIAAAKLASQASVTFIDVNTSALRLASINAIAAGVSAQTVRSDKLVAGADLILANPPYMMDGRHRAYRDGGGLLGGAVALDWVRQSLKALSIGGTLLLYTGAAVSNGHSPLVEAIEDTCSDYGAALELTEIDPDVFGEELEMQAYEGVERISVIGAVVTR